MKNIMIIRYKFPNCPLECIQTKEKKYKRLFLFVCLFFVNRQLIFPSYRVTLCSILPLAVNIIA